jgi:hypothetical protein
MRFSRIRLTDGLPRMVTLPPDIEWCFQDATRLHRSIGLSQPPRGDSPSSRDIRPTVRVLRHRPPLQGPQAAPVRAAVVALRHAHRRRADGILAEADRPGKRRQRLQRGLSACGRRHFPRCRHAQAWPAAGAIVHLREPKPAGRGPHGSGRGVSMGRQLVQAATSEERANLRPCLGRTGGAIVERVAVDAIEPAPDA